MKFTSSRRRGWRSEAAPRGAAPRVPAAAARPERALETDGREPAAELLIEGAILHLRADLEWLELIEQRLALNEEV